MIGASGQNEIRYVALGDSYTIGENVKEGERWPNQLVKHLNVSGINIKLVANPSRTGWATQNLIDEELPVLDKANTQFVTLLIGANDFFQGVPNDVFRDHFVFALDHILSRLPDKKKCLVITIPDYTVTPSGKYFAQGRDGSKGIAEFNEIIKEESLKRGASIVDVYPVSQKMRDDKSLISGDGLHPSGKGYAEWEKLIYPVSYKLLVN